MRCLTFGVGSALTGPCGSCILPRFFPFWEFAASLSATHSIHRIYLSLDKQPKMRYPLVKVLLTVSPARPSFSPQPDPFPPSPRPLTPLSTAFTPNRSLTPLSTAFTQTHRGVGYWHNFSFHWTRTTAHKSRRFILLRTLCRSQKNQLLCNQSNPNSFVKTPGVWGTHSATPRTLGVIIARRFSNPLFSYSYELLFPQTLSFHNHPHCPGVSPS